MCIYIYIYIYIYITSEKAGAAGVRGLLVAGRGAGLALALRQKALEPFNSFPLRSEAALLRDNATLNPNL